MKISFFPSHTGITKEAIAKAMKTRRFNEAKIEIPPDFDYLLP
jgi:hypothetical protein